MTCNSIVRSQLGFLLIESLIALLLFSLGILGLIGMQATAAKVTADSQYRAEASMHVDHLLSQMRSSNRTTLATDYSDGGVKYEAWLTSLQDPLKGLPGTTSHPPTVVIDDVAPNPFTVTVTVFWLPPSETIPRQYVAVATLNR